MLPERDDGPQVGRAIIAVAILAAVIVLATTACSGSVSESDERELGAYQAAYIDSAVPLVRDSVITSYVTTLGRSMTSHTSRAGLDWRYTVVDTSLVNAMALPGGFVYVTRGLIEQSGQLDELAGVMAHEIGHVVRRHSVTQLQKAGKREIALLMLCTLTNVCNTIGGEIAVQLGADAATAHYSQHDEAEADSEAVVITAVSGIDPAGLSAFLERVLAQRTERPTSLDAFFASHPTDEARIFALRRQITGLGHPAGQLLRDTPEFHAVQARLRSLSPRPQHSTTEGTTGGPK